jgi:hypothetical protein
MNSIIKLTLFFIFIVQGLSTDAQSYESWDFENYNGKSEQNCKKFKAKEPRSIYMSTSYSSMEIFNISGTFEGCQLQDGTFWLNSILGPKSYNKAFYMIGNLSGGKLKDGEITINETETPSFKGVYKFERIYKDGNPTDYLAIKGNYRGLEISGTAKMIFKYGFPHDIYYDSISYSTPDGKLNHLKFNSRTSKDLPLGKLIYPNGNIYIGTLSHTLENPVDKGTLYCKNGVIKAGRFSHLSKHKFDTGSEIKITYPDESWASFYVSQMPVETKLNLKDGSNKLQIYVLDSLIATEGTPEWEAYQSEKKRKAEEAKMAQKLKWQQDSVLREQRKNEPTYKAPDIHCVTFILKKTTGTINVSVRYSAVYVQIEDYTNAASDDDIVYKAKSVMDKEVTLNGFQVEKEFLDRADCEEAKKAVLSSGLELSDFRKIYGTIE